MLTAVNTLVPSIGRPHAYAVRVRVRKRKWALGIWAGNAYLLVELLTEGTGYLRYSYWVINAVRFAAFE